MKSTSTEREDAPEASLFLPESDKPRVSVIILNYNTCDDLDRLVEGLAEARRIFG